MRTSEHLRAARARITAFEDWGGGETPEGRWCACQAIWREMPRNEDTVAACEAALVRSVGLNPTGVEVPSEDAPHLIFKWNDAPERTHAEVLAAFDRAIVNEEAREQEFSPSDCEPVAFDAMPMDLMREALGETAPFTADEHAAWVRAWEGI